MPHETETAYDDYSDDRESSNKTLRRQLYVVLGLMISDVVAVSERISGNGYLRDLVPEPFDYFDHAGNFAYSILGAYAAVMATEYAAKKTNLSFEPGRLKKIALGAGVCAAFMANALSETKIGVSLIDADTTPDLLDGCYGMASGVFGAHVASKLITPTEEAK